MLGVADPSAFELVCAFCARVETFSGLRRSRIEAMNPGRRSSCADGLVAAYARSVVEREYEIILQPEPEGGFSVFVPELPSVVT